MADPKDKQGTTTLASLEADKDGKKPTEQQPEQQPPEDENKEKEAKQTKAKEKPVDHDRQDLLAEIARLQKENDALRSGNDQEVHNEYLNEEPITDDNQRVAIFVSSKDTTYEARNGQKLVTGDVNGEKFEVECDRQTFVKPSVAEALRPLIRKQQGTRA
jgi:hypothetical protein